jgi:hypothetical protein
MKGDFSRLTFDPRKHYRSVRMQQGRVQLDADWNEQADIFDYLQRTQSMAVMGDHGVPAAGPDAFAILVDQPEEAEQGEAGAVQPGSGEVSQPGAQAPAAPGPPGEAAAPPSKDFRIGAGHCYVDGILCENDSKVAFTEQPDYPPGAAQAMLESLSPGQRYMAYLDVWQRHISLHQDPALLEVALGGPDTTTRAKTVWQVKLWPLPDDVADADDWRERGGLRSRADWEAFVNKAADRGRLRAKWEKEKGAIRENHLYRVEIHTVDNDQVTFKWSRENGSVVFPIREEYLFNWEDVPGKDNDRLLRYLREGFALDWVEGAIISKPDDGPMIRIEKHEDWVEIVLDEGDKTATLTTSDDKRGLLKVTEENGRRKLYKIVLLSVDSGTIECNLENLERDPYQLSQNDWVEIVDDVTALKGLSPPLCKVKELDRQHGKITLQAHNESIKRILAEIGERELQHPLLRRWEEDAKTISETWLDLENGIQVSFSDTGSYQVGDYWLIPARTSGADGSIQWPTQEDGQPQAQPPHGIAHHYAPLARLQWTEAGWTVEEDRRLLYSPLTALTAARDDLQAGIQELETRLKSIIDQLADGIDRALELAVNKGGMFHDYPSAESLEEGDVVALDVDHPDHPDHVKRASTQNAALVLGVVTQDLGEQTYRIALYGLAKCKVQGQVKPGDLLVPSANAGCAARGELYIQPGTQVGKALEASQPDETRLIKILVTLG